MSAYYEFLMDLWRRNIPEFLSQSLKLLEVLSPEEKDRVFRLYIKSLPEEVVAGMLKDNPAKR